MENASYCKRLKKAKVFPAIKSSFGARLPQDGMFGYWLETLIGRWSVRMHTFVLEWGEITPTPEDVSPLPSLGHFYSYLVVPLYILGGDRLTT